MEKTISLLLVAMFVMGTLTGISVFKYFNKEESPINFETGGNERLSQSDHVKEDQIFVDNDKVLIQLDQEVTWSRYSNSNSMDPFLDKGCNGIEIFPESEKDIKTGDIVAYSFGEDLIVHRVVEIGEDEQGWFAITKGDNNSEVDPGKRRLQEIKRITVGVIC